MSNIVTRSKTKQAREQEALQQVNVDFIRIRNKRHHLDVVDTIIKEFDKYPQLSKYRNPRAICSDIYYEFPTHIWETISGFDKEGTENYMKTLVEEFGLIHPFRGVIEYIQPTKVVLYGSWWGSVLENVWHSDLLPEEIEFLEEGENPGNREKLKELEQKFLNGRNREKEFKRFVSVMSKFIYPSREI